MKRLSYRLLMALGLLAGGQLTVTAGDSESWVCYAPTGAARPVPSPGDNCEFNCILAENSGGYVAVWDDATNHGVILEQRAGGGAQIWQQRLALATNETTRVVLGSASRVLWCSAQRWVFLQRDTGAIVSTDRWDQPRLDPNKIIIQNDILHVINNDVAARFDTNMNPLGSVSAAPPEGLWSSYAGNWLLDLSARTNHGIQTVSITTGQPTQVTLPTTTEGGYTEHRVLGANAASLFVVSSINWPTDTLHYFTLFSGNGVLFQKRMSFNETITGATPLPDGWLLSTRSLGETFPKHYLFKVDTNGTIHPHLLIAPSSPQSYVALNTSPPRVLHVIDSRHLEILDATAKPWWQWWFGGGTLMYPPVDLLQSTGVTPQVGTTNYFWMSPICPNNR
jgi:hypothetical protein